MSPTPAACAGISAHRTLLGSSFSAGLLGDGLCVPNVTCGSPDWQWRRALPGVLLHLRFCGFLRQLCICLVAPEFFLVPSVLLSEQQWEQLVWCAFLGSNPGVGLRGELAGAPHRLLERAFCWVVLRHVRVTRSVCVRSAWWWSFLERAAALNSTRSQGGVSRSWYVGQRCATQAVGDC
jgi:hypothetical protein